MALFQNSFFRSKNDEIEAEYTKGVQSLKSGRNADAAAHFQKAAAGGHVSALHNLSMMHGGGLISPWSFDLAADCWYKAAELGHPTAKQNLWLLEAADRGGFGYDNLAKMTAEQANGGQINGTLMICAARFTDVLCKKFGATNDVIAYEIDAARQSEDDDVQAFLTRTGLPEELTLGGLNRLIEGSAADQITNGLNQFSVAQIKSGVKDAHVRMARCTIVGYVIQKSIYGGRCQPLLGLDRFFGHVKPSSFKLDSAEAIIEAVNKFGLPQVAERIRQEAFNGNLACQIFLSQAALHHNDSNNAEIFTKLAAEAGDPSSQANLALIYLKKVDFTAEYFSEEEVSLIKSAKAWHRKAAAQGFQPSITALENLEVFPDSMF